jgi:hypothetical protein
MCAAIGPPAFYWAGGGRTLGRHLFTGPAVGAHWAAIFLLGRRWAHTGPPSFYWAGGGRTLGCHLFTGLAVGAHWAAIFLLGRRWAHTGLPSFYWAGGGRTLGRQLFTGPAVDEKKSGRRKKSHLTSSCRPSKKISKFSEFFWDFFEIFYGRKSNFKEDK